MSEDDRPYRAPRAGDFMRAIPGDGGSSEGMRRVRVTELDGCLWAVPLSGGMDDMLLQEWLDALPYGAERIPEP